jgi:hypothetical protein
LNWLRVGSDCKDLDYDDNIHNIKFYDKIIGESMAKLCTMQLVVNYGVR